MTSETTEDESVKVGCKVCAAVSLGLIYVEEAVCDTFIVTAVVSVDEDVVKIA